MFELSETQLQPCTKRQLLASLLHDVLDAHWTRAIGCLPQPALMVQLSLETALHAG